MAKNHIAFVNLPHPPHVNPTLAIVSVLVRRGHRVTYVTSERFAGRVIAMGAEVVPCEGFDPALAAFYPEPRWPTLGEIEPFYRANRPDLVIYDFFAPAGRILAHRMGVPAILSRPSFAHDKNNWEKQMPNPETRKATLVISDHLDSMMESHGVPSTGSFFHKEKLNIHLFPKILQPEGDVFGESFFYAGRCAAEQPYYGDWRKRDSGGRATVLVSNSTTYVQGPGFFRECIEALSSLHCHVLLSIGDSGNAAALEPLPDHVEVVQRNSHVKILPYVDAFICTGGIITASEATYHGVPLIVTSLGISENEWEGDIFERLGIAIHIREAVRDVRALKSATRRALQDPAMRHRVQEIQRIVQREPGGEEAANRIEAHLEACSTGAAGAQR